MTNVVRFMQACHILYLRSWSLACVLPNLHFDRLAFALGFPFETRFATETLETLLCLSDRTASDVAASDVVRFVSVCVRDVFVVVAGGLRQLHRRMDHARISAA